MNFIVVYHKNCHDGMASAWCFHHLNVDKKIEYFPCGNSDQKLPDNLENKIVYLVDFVYTYENMCTLLKKCLRVLVFDHHKTNLEVLMRLKNEFVNLEYYFDMDRSGCQLTWDVVSEGRPRPLFLDYIGDRDIWKFKLPDSKLVTKALYIYPASFESFDMLNKTANFREKMIEQGSVLDLQMSGFILPYYKSVASDRVMFVNDKHYKVKLVECPYFHRSEVGDYLSMSADFVALWSYDVDKQLYSISFRSRDDIDVGEIAKYYGGGGHKCASAISWSDSLDKLFKKRN